MRLQNLSTKKGFDTTLISGPTNLEIDDDINLVKVETAEEMFLATQKSLPTNVAIFAAAVADFKLQKKYKKPNKDEKLALEALVKTLDKCNDKMSPEDIQTLIYSTGKEMVIQIILETGLN